MTALELNKRMELKIDIWFKLTLKQRKRLNAMDYDHLFLEIVPIEIFNSVTANIKLQNDFKAYKFSYKLRLLK